MNDIIREVFICSVLFCLMVGSFYLIMDLFSVRAKITASRIKKYSIYLIILSIVFIAFLGVENIRGGILYVAILINCFLFEEEHVLNKTWKMVIVVCIENLMEFVVNVFVDWFYNNIWGSWIVYDLMVGVVVFLIILAAVTIVKKLKIFNQTRVESIIFSKAEGILLCTLAICAVFTPAFASIIYTVSEEFGFRVWKVTLWSIVSTITSLGLILGVDKNIAQNYYQKVNELIETQFKNQVTYYEKIEESNKEIRAIKHDMKNHLISMQGLLHSNQLQELDQYIDDIRTTIGKKVIAIKTGNTIVDAILNEKNAVAHEKNIAMQIKVGIQEQINIELIDLCIILSNSIDNAIEACEHIEDESKRMISISCNYQAGYFLYQITNSMKEESLSKIRGKLLTIKKDKQNHGFGVGNIKQSVRKYGGEVKTSAENFKFKLEVEINTKEALALQA